MESRQDIAKTAPQRDGPTDAARRTLASLKPFGQWFDEKDRAPCETRIAINVVLELLSLANLSPAEHAATAKKLELDAATAAMEMNYVH